MIDVSVVVPTHDRRQILPQTVQSILCQRGVAIELIAVNDGSTDGTGPWLDRLAATDPRGKVVHHAEPRFGPGARNAGLAPAAGRRGAFCGGGGGWAPDKAAGQLSALRGGSARWGCTGVAVVDERLQVI